MDYGDHRYKSRRYLDNQSCASFIARADISSFYPSLYTHSIPWAIVGIDTAKANTSNNLWYNALDRDLRFCRRSETNGVSIGPGTSSLMAEIVLSQVDRRLEKEFVFERFIDDYTCYATSRSAAQAFLRLLESELGKYNLYLNFRKTHITELPAPELPEWIDQLRVGELSANPQDFYQIKMFISRALHVAEKYPDGSVLRYAMHALCERNFTTANGEYVLRRVAGLAQGYLHIVPCVAAVIAYGYDKGGRFKYGKELLSILAAAAAARRSDAMCWSLHLCKETGTKLDTAVEQEIMKSFDTMTLILLYEAGSTQIRRAITRFARKRILSRPPSVIQRNWMLIHYLLNTGRLKQNEVTDPSLRALRVARADLFG